MQGRGEPASGLTFPAPRWKDDLCALLELALADQPLVRVVRSNKIHTAFYGFGDASAAGFGATVERPDVIHGRFGIWAKDEDKESSNFRELLNLVEMVEEEAKGVQKDSELWLFTDNSTAESCFAKGSSKSRLLHGLLVLRLRRVEMNRGCTLHMIHVAGTRMIAQGTDGLSRGLLMEGVMRGDRMLNFIDISKTAVDRHPPILEYIRLWAGPQITSALKPEEWFVEGHGITGGQKDAHTIWIPQHAPNGRTYLWAPPPVLGDIALEECLKATHKRSDACHIFVLPRLYTPLWSRLFFKLCDFHFRIPAGSPRWPSGMHEPLWIGIALPFIRHRPWTWEGTCKKCLLPVKAMGGIFCANFCDSRNGFPACRSVWHEECYECLGIGKFPMMKQTDADGNLWHEQSKFELRHNRGVRGAHVCFPFQCEDCWLINLEDRLPLPESDAVLVMMIRRANLDAINSRAPATIKAHVAAVNRTIRHCKLLHKTPALGLRGPMPTKDPVGMGLAVEMLFLSVTARPRLRDQEFIQFDTMRKPRGTFSQLWISLPKGIAEGSAFAGGFAKNKATQCPSQSEWFGGFMQGAEARMGFATQSNRPLHIRTIVRVLEVIKEQANAQVDIQRTRELIKVGAAMVTALVGSLRGPEVFMLDLGGIRCHIDRGRDGVMPVKLLKVGVDLTEAPHVYLALVGKFKGELGIQEHLVAVAGKTRSGIETRWWLEQLIKVREEEGHTSGPAFGLPDGSLAFISDYDMVLHELLKMVQGEPGSGLDADDDVVANYSFFRSFRKTAED